VENRYWEGDCRAQLVWHVSWAVLQFNKHIVLAVALLVVVAAAAGGVPGTTQAV
jgi:hypothetical protein